MALSNTQYDTILRDYNQKRLDSRRILEERTREIYDKLPDYKEMDDLIASISVNRAKQRLMGTEAKENNEEIADILEDINTRKKLLLTSAGYSVNYLDPVYTCSYCKDTGYIGDEKCHCFKQAVLDLLYEQSNIRDVLSTENFKNLSFEYQSGEDLVHFKKATQKAEEFVQAFDYDYRNLLFYGTVGTGKSFLSNCVANALLEKGHSVIYFSAAGLFERISEYTFQKGGKDASVNPFDDIYNCDLLIIDDLGTELTNSFVTSQLFACLNERHLRRKATIISSNLNLEELRERYSDRVFSRITSNYELCKLSGQDVRLYLKRMMSRK
ncbi:MAG: ATP-binding protein [Lachnospiraceae bacterium]|nr:ATP-binding protein [Lachnospiraceae bacterium]